MSSVREVRIKNDHNNHQRTTARRTFDWSTVILAPRANRNWIVNSEKRWMDSLWPYRTLFSSSRNIPTNLFWRVCTTSYGGRFTIAVYYLIYVINFNMLHVVHSRQVHTLFFSSLTTILIQINNATLPSVKLEFRFRFSVNEIEIDTKQ